MHRQEFVVGRIAQRAPASARRAARAGPRRRDRATARRSGAPIGAVAVKIADRALEPDRRRMEAADRGKAPRRHRKRNDAGRRRRRRRAARVDRVRVAPQAEQIAAALAERLRDRDPAGVIDLVARPRPVTGRPACSSAISAARRSLIAVIPAAPPRRGTSAPPARAATARPSAPARDAGTAARRTP